MNKDGHKKTSQTVCGLKWVQVLISVWEGSSRSCSLVQSDAFQTAGEIHNQQRLINDRAAMLKEEWPTADRGCTACQHHEAQRGMSLRRHKNTHLDWQGCLPEAFTLEHQTPYLAEVFFRNKCPMKCLYCGPKHSSGWENENNQFHQNTKLSPNADKDSFALIEKKYQKHLAEFWLWLKGSSNHLRSFKVNGGEPLVQREFWDCVNFFTRNPNPNLSFKFSSGLQADPSSFSEGVRKLHRLRQHVGKIEIDCSLDGWNQQASFIRSGSDLRTFDKNFTQLLKFSRDLDIKMNVTVSALNLYALYPLIVKTIDWQKLGNFHLSFSKCNSPSYLDPVILPGEKFTSEFGKIVNSLYKAPVVVPEAKKLRRIFFDIKTLPSKPLQLGRLKQTLDILDQRRDTDWRKTFPWLARIETSGSQFQPKKSA